MIFYKIRSKSTGKYRLSGGEPKWNKSGKVFDSLGKLRLFLSNCISYNKHNKNFPNINDFSDMEIIEYEVTEKEVKRVHEIISPEKLINLLQG